MVDHLDVNESRPRAIRAVFHNILFDRMRASRPAPASNNSNPSIRQSNQQDQVPRTISEAPISNGSSRNGSMDESNGQSRRFQPNVAALPRIGESEPIREEREPPIEERKIEEEKVDYSSRSKAGPIIPSRSPARNGITLPQGGYPATTRENTADVGPPPSNQAFRTSSMSTNAYSRAGQPQTTLSIPDSQSQYSTSEAPQSATYVASPLENSAIAFPPPLSSPGTPYGDEAETMTSEFRAEQQQQQNGRAPIRLDPEMISRPPGRTDPMAHATTLHPTASMGSRRVARNAEEDGVESPIPTRQIPSPVEMISSRIPEPVTTPRQAARSIPGPPPLGNPVEEGYLEEQLRMQQSLSSSRTESDYSQHDARPPTFQNAPLPVPSTSSDAPVTLRRSYDMHEDSGIHSDVRRSPLLAQDNTDALAMQLLAALSFVENSERERVDNPISPTHFATRSSTVRTVAPISPVRSPVIPTTDSSPEQRYAQPIEVPLPNSAITSPTDNVPSSFPSTFSKNKRAEERAAAAQIALQAQQMQATRPGRSAGGPSKGKQRAWKDSDDEEEELEEEESDDEGGVMENEIPQSCPFMPHSGSNAYGGARDSYYSTTNEPAYDNGRNYYEDQQQQQPLQQSQNRNSSYSNMMPPSLAQPSMVPAMSPHGLLHAGLLDKADRSARNQEVQARDTGGPLVNIPSKPPPPQVGLVGAITSHQREKERTGGVGRALTEQQRDRKLAEQRQKQLDENQRQQLMMQQQQMSQYGGGGGGYGGGMNPMMMNPMMMNPWMMGGYGGMGMQGPGGQMGGSQMGGSQMGGQQLGGQMDPVRHSRIGFFRRYTDSSYPDRLCSNSKR